MPAPHWEPASSRSFALAHSLPPRCERPSTGPQRARKGRRTSVRDANWITPARAWRSGSPASRAGDSCQSSLASVRSAAAETTASTSIEYVPVDFLRRRSSLPREPASVSGPFVALMYLCAGELPTRRQPHLVGRIEIAADPQPRDGGATPERGQEEVDCSRESVATVSKAPSSSGGCGRVAEDADPVWVKVIEPRIGVQASRLVGEELAARRGLQRCGAWVEVAT